MNLIKHCLLILLTPAAGISLHAATLSYGFDGQSTSPTSTVPGTTATSLLNIDYCSPFGGNPGAFCGRFDNSGASGSRYAYFTISPNGGAALNLLSFSFDEKNFGPLGLGPTAFDVYTSVDGFATSILGGALPPDATVFTTHSVSLTGPQFQDLTSPVTVRISGYGGPPPPGTEYLWGFDNVTLNLDVVSPAPEPASFGLASGTAGLLLSACACRSLRRRKQPLHRG